MRVHGAKEFEDLWRKKCEKVGGTNRENSLTIGNRRRIGVGGGLQFAVFSENGGFEGLRG